MMLQMLSSKLHIICCLRAQYASHQIEKADYERYGIKSNAKTTVIRDDFQTPIQDKNFIFEMMAHVELSNKQPGVPILRKCPDMLLPAFQKTQRLSIDTGAAIAEWTAGGAPDTQEDETLLDDAENAAKCGLAAYQRWFTQDISNAQREHLAVKTGEHERLKKIAADVDAQDGDGFPGDQ